MDPHEASGARERGDRLDRVAKQATLHLLWIVPLIVVPIAFYARAFQDLVQGDALAAAQVAREIVRGHGFATLWAYPIEVALKGAQFPRPEVAHAPLYSLVLAVFFGAFSASDKVVAAASVVFLIATGLVVFRLADRAFGRTAACLSVLFLVMGLYTLLLAISGRSDTMAMFLVALAALLLYPRECSSRRTAAAGAVLALGYLTDYSTLALTIPFALFVLYSAPERRWRRLALFAGAFVVVAAPWWVRNAKVAGGDPFFSLRRYWAQMYSGTHPGLALLRSTDTSALGVWHFLAAQPKEFARKIMTNLRTLHSTVPGGMGIYVVAFFLAGILHPLKDDRARLLRKCLYLALALQVVLASAQNGELSMVMSLLPLVVVFAAGFFVHLLQRLDSRAARGWAVAVFLGLIAYPTLVGLVRPPRRYNPSPENLKDLARVVPEKTAVLSDAPWAVAWYADRPAVLLPREQQDVEFVQDRAKIGAVYLSRLLYGWPAQEQPGPWRLMARAGLKGFVPAWRPQDRGGEALLISDEIAAKLPAAARPGPTREPRSDERQPAPEPEPETPPAPQPGRPAR